MQYGRVTFSQYKATHNKVITFRLLYLKYSHTCVSYSNENKNSCKIVLNQHS